jgi:ribose 5-phosphate isomerase A
MSPNTTESDALSAIEASKRSAAQQAVKDHFDPSAKYIGIGSGSTIVYVVEAISAIDDPRVKEIRFVPTGYQSRRVQFVQQPSKQTSSD